MHVKLKARCRARLDCFGAIVWRNFRPEQQWALQVILSATVHFSLSLVAITLREQRGTHSVVSGLKRSEVIVVGSVLGPSKPPVNHTQKVSLFNGHTHWWTLVPCAVYSAA